MVENFLQSIGEKMPIYDYECTKCKVLEEKMVKSGDEPHFCPVCGEQMVKLIGAPSFQLLGTGWYKTDFAGKNDSPSAE